MTKPYTALVIDPDHHFREEVCAMLVQAGLEVVGSAENLSMLPPLPPSQITIMMIGGLAQDNLKTLLRAAHARAPEAQIIVLGGVGADSLEASEALENGAYGYFKRPLSVSDFLEAVRLIAHGYTVSVGHPFSRPGLPVERRHGALDRRSGLRDRRRRAVLEALSRLQPSPVAGERKLSIREAAILALIAKGDSNKLIAGKLDIAEPTVKAHVKTILRKIDASNRVQAAIWAVRHLKETPAE